MDRAMRSLTTMLCLFSLAGAHAATQENILVIELKQGLVRLQQASSSNTQVKDELAELVRTVPEIKQTLGQLANSRSVDRNRYDLDRQFFFDAKGKSPSELQQTQQKLQNNGLVQSAEFNVVTQPQDSDQGKPVSLQRNTANRPLYLLSPTPSAGNLLEGINADAVSGLPGGQGERARVIIAADSYWDQSHSNLPHTAFSPIRPAQRLACGLYWGVGAEGTRAAGIIADKTSGIVPQAQLMATAASSMGSIYFSDINAAGVRAGDVVVINALTNEQTPHYYPGTTCKGGTVCTLPLALAVTQNLANIEYLTEHVGAHVVISAGGGTRELSPSWQSLYPRLYMPINLDNPDLQGNFDRPRNDDGSILVGSVTPRTGTAEGANYGERIDLSTWATDITAASYQAGVKNLYTRYDKAAPLDYKLSAWIVAGAVAKIQSIAFAKGLGAVPPKVMRDLLVSTGHDFAYATPGISRGRHPDVKAAVEKMLATYGNGFPPTAPGPTIKRIEGPGFAGGKSGSSFGGARSNTTATFTPVLNAAAQGVRFHWQVSEPLIVRSVDANTGVLQVDVPAMVGSEWRQPPPPIATVTLETQDNNGVTDKLARSTHLMGIYTTDTATWNVPDTLDAGTTTTFTVTPHAPGPPNGYQIRWFAQGLFPGFQEKIGTNAPYSISITAPNVKEDLHVTVKAGGTLYNAAPIGRGFFLSKTVTIRAAGANRPVGTLDGIDSAVSGYRTTYTANARDPDGHVPLTYAWAFPPDVTGTTNGQTASLTLPVVAADTQRTISVAVTNSRGGVLKLDKTITVKTVPPLAKLSGPDTVLAGSSVAIWGASTQGNNMTYRWSAPGFTPDASTLRPQTINPTFTAPANMAAGQRSITLTATDGFGRTSSATHLVTVIAAQPSPTVEILGPNSIRAGQTVTYTAQASNLPDGTPRYSWRKPAELIGTASNSPTLVVTAPTVERSLTVTLGVIAGVGTQQATASKTITVAPADVVPPDQASCAPTWNAATTYPTPGVKVSYAGYNYEVAYWTQNNRPDTNFVLSGSAKPWRRLAPCGQ